MTSSTEKDYFSVINDLRYNEHHIIIKNMYSSKLQKHASSHGCELPMKKYESFPKEVIDLYKSNDVLKYLPGIRSGKGQALCLLSEPYLRNGKYFLTREDCESFCEYVGIRSKDSIQHFNKQHLVRVKDVKKGYSLKYPFELKKNDLLKRENVEKHVKLAGSKTDQICAVKSFWTKRANQLLQEADIYLRLLKYERDEKVYNSLESKLREVKDITENILDVDERDWQIGHLRAQGGNDPDNLRWQPPIQARYRDRYIFNEYFEKLRI
tara:strand:- start:1455 stop:2255 length:801 start_codon:yes stop_codon:yes gene_type:complete